ncbi:ferredoxin [Clostridium thermosuccinogenes]
MHIDSLAEERGDIMKASIDREGCIACGLCPATCPEVFRMAEDGFAEVYVDEVPKGAEEAAKEAEAGCPVSVITVE